MFSNFLKIIFKFDDSFFVRLSTETKPDPVTTKDKSTLLEPDTATWYICYNNQWYPQ